MTRYSNEHRDCIFVKGYGLLSFAENIGKNIRKSKHLRDVYNQKLFDHVKQSPTDAFKTTSKRVVQTAEATGDLIGNKIADAVGNSCNDKITRTSAHNIAVTDPSETNYIRFDAKIPKERSLLTEERQHIIDELRII